MAVKVSGNRGLNFVGTFDISEIEEKSKRVIDLYSDLSRQTSSLAGKVAVDDSYRQEQVAIQKALADSRVALQKLKEEQQAQRAEQEKSRTVIAAERAEIEKLKAVEAELNNQYKAGRIALQEYTLEQRKIGDAQREALRAQKEAERTLREQTRLQKEQERQAERNRKALEKESSEYYKLTQALGTVRKEAKDVQAEMFRLEREGLKASDAYRQLEIRSKALTTQTQILDRGVKQIDASLGLHQRNVGNYGDALTQISPIFASINQNLGLFGTSLDALSTTKDPFKALGASLVAFGRATVAFMLTPVGAIITTLAALFALIAGNKKTVVEFDAGLRGVQKTTNMLDEDLFKFGDSIIALSNNLKSVSSKELLEYAQVAGQLGVKGSANILRFSETLAKLQTASNISGEEGASEIARLLTLTDGGVENVQAFGDEIVNLGNNFAATEKEILGNAERIAQNTGLYKIGRQEVLAYATATKAVGVEAELVGSTFGRTLGTIEKALRTGNGAKTFAAVTGKSVEDLKKAFKEDASGVFNDFITGLNKVNKAGGSVNAVLEQTGINAIRDQAVLASLATNGYEVLNDAMEKVRNSNGALGNEFETANKKLENVGKRVGIAWDNLVLSVENGQGIFAKTGSYIGNEFANFLVSTKGVIDEMGIAFDVFSQFLADNASKAEEAGKANAQYADSFGPLKDFFEQISIRSFVFTFTVEIPNALRTAGAYVDVFSNTVQQFFRFLQTAGPEIGKYLKDALNPFADADSTNIDKLYEGFKGRVKSQNDFIIDDTKRVNAEQARLFAERYDAATNKNKIGEEYARNTQELTPEQQAAIKAEQERMQAEVEAAKKAAAERLAAQRAMQAKIDELNAGAHRKQLSREEAEIQAVKDKYIKIRKEIDDFYKNPKNAGLKVDTSGLAASEQKELENVLANQEVEATKASLAEQKQLFQEFENYKAEFGADAAKKRFKGDIAEFENYVAYLRSLVPDESDQSVRAIRMREALGPIIAKAEREAEKQQMDSYNKLLKSLRTYEEEREKIIRDFAEKRRQLMEGGDSAALAELERQYKASLDALDDANAKQLQAFKDLFAGVDELTDRQAKAVVSAAETKLKELVAQGRISAELQKDLEKLLKETSAAIKDRLPQRLVNLAGALRNAAGAVSELDAGFGQVLGTVGNVIDNVVAIKDNLDIMQKGFGPGGNFLSGLTGAVGVIGGVFAAISVAKGIADQMNAKSEARQRAAAAQQQYLADMQINANNAIVENLAKQLELIKEIYGTERITEYRRNLEAVKQEYNEIAESIIKSDPAKVLGGGNVYALTGIKELDEVIEKYNQGLVGATAFMPGDYWTKEDVAKLQNISALVNDLTDPDKKIAALAELEELLNKGLLDAGTAAAIENLLALQEQFKDTMNALNAELTGFSLDSLISDIQSIFADGGADSAQAFSDNFNEQIQKSLLQKLTRDALEKQMQGYYDLFAEYAEDGLDEKEILKLREEYDKRIAEAKQKLADLEATSGVDIDNSDKASKANQNTLSGAIRASLTEETGGKLAGILQGQFGLMKQQLFNLEGLRLDMGGLLAIGREQINYAMQTAQNTRLTYESTNRMEGTLTDIKTVLSNNAGSSGASARDLGLDG